MLNNEAPLFQDVDAETTAKINKALAKKIMIRAGIVLGLAAAVVITIGAIKSTDSEISSIEPIDTPNE